MCGLNRDGDGSAALVKFPSVRDVRAVARREFENLQPRLWVGLTFANLLPPYTATWARVALLRAGGLKIGARTGIGGKIWIGGGPLPASRIEIGADCFLNDGCRFDVLAPVTIGDHVFLGHDVAVLTATHERGTQGRRAGFVVAAPVTIGSGAWLGARVTVLGGVTIGDGAVVAAGAVVTRSVPSGTLVAGVPAEVIRNLDGRSAT